MEHPELVPLEGGEFGPLELRRKRPPAGRQTSHYGRRSCVKGPLRAVRLVLLITVVPALFIFIPIYLRYRVFSGQMYPVGMTDMRMIDNKISTTWCQKQVVRSNATFNAYLMSEQPHISADLVPVSMTRYLSLQDDMKEYWGFYLLEGSVVTVSTCVRWPGASLTMIKGHKHLQDCAFIGDDSSEELEELLEANEMGLLNNETLLQRIRTLLKDDSPANDPDAMKRHKGGVRFHDQAHDEHEPNTLLQHDALPLHTPDVTDHDPQELQQILERLHSQRRAGSNHEEKMDEEDLNYQPPAHLMSLPALHRHRDTNVDREERQWLSFNDLDGNSTFQESGKPFPEIEDIVIENNSDVTTVVIVQRNNDTAAIENNNDITTKDDVHRNNDNAAIENNSDITTKDDVHRNNDTAAGVNKVVIPIKDEQEDIDDNKPDQLNSIDAEKTPSSVEVYEDILIQLESLGEKGRRVLERLSNNTRNITGITDVKLTPTTLRSELKEELDEAQAELRLNHLRKILVEAIDEETRKDELRNKRREANENARTKRELLIKQAEFQKSLNEDDEGRNSAIEEGLEADGFAEVHHVVNETTANDMSNSEFWSSFSSSEEALLECEGLILNLPLTPHPACAKNASDVQHGVAAQHNAVTYRVPANGYYFFVFNSENEVQENFIRVKFDLQKTTYDVRRTLLECRNYTDKCDIPLHFFSAEKVVLEVPLRDNDSLWNEEFVVTSECVPRTSIYLVCVIAVPFLIVVFAFQ